MAAVNPVLRRELLERWRGRRAFVVFTVYVGFLAVVMQLMYWVGRRVLEEQLRFGFSEVAGGPVLGRFLFENAIGFVLLLVLFITPGYAAAQISGERERRTLALLQVTLVRPWSIVAGKLGASVAWSLLLIAAAMPFGAAAFFLGGVNVADLLRATLVVAVVAVSVAGIGLGISSATRRTTASVVVTYATILALTLGTLFAAAVESAVRRFDFDGSRPIALYLNPFYGLADAARADSFRFVGSELPSVLTPFGFALPERNVVRFGGRGFPGEPMIDPPVGRGFDLASPVVVDGFGDGFAVDREPVWLLVLAAYALLGAVGFVVATQRVRPDKVPPFLSRRRNGARRIEAGGLVVEPLEPDLGTQAPALASDQVAPSSGEEEP